MSPLEEAAMKVREKVRARRLSEALLSGPPTLEDIAERALAYATACAELEDALVELAARSRGGQ